MALPHVQITPIPNTEPDAVPALWNVRYDEIDDNFEYLESQRSAHHTRLTAVEGEITTARGGQATLDGRLDALGEQIQALDPETQTAMAGELIALRGETGLINRELQRQRTVRHQEGVLSLTNRGLVYGAALSKNLVHARTLDISAGRLFLGGHLYSLPAEVSTTSIPGNSGAAAATCYAYLHLSGGVVTCDTTLLGEQPPAEALPIYRIVVPAGNTEASDPYLANVTLTPIARVEPYWPSIQTSPAFVDVVLPSVMAAADYAIHFDPLNSSGGVVPDLRVDARATNGFRVYLGGSADSVSVRYTATLMQQ